MGTLQFVKIMRNTTTDITVRMDRMVAEHDQDNRSARCHLLSVIGNDQEIAAIAAAVSEDARFYASGPGFSRLLITLGADAETFRGSISVPGRKRPIRHLIGVSEELSNTRPGGHSGARRTTLCKDEPEFLLYRLGIRFGLPVLPEWSNWFYGELERHKAIERLIGVGCSPVVVKGTKKRFLGWIGHALKRGAIQIPEDDRATSWKVPGTFTTAPEAAEDEAA
jgi:hypothetical protein